MSSRLLVGRTVGAISARPSGGAVLTNATGGVDFAIGGLGFRLAIGDDKPYQRATAQFRKDQLDSASSVGDQSLTGWWKRGQLSFHKGAGIRFYEVLDGESIFNRFLNSTDVLVSTPGEVSLGSDWADGDTDPPAVARVASAGGLAVFLSSSGDVSSEDAVGSLGTLCRAVTGDPAGRVWAATTANQIVLTNTALTAPVVKYTHTQSITHLWYAKSRLWAMDALGDLYQLAPDPGAAVAIGSSDLVTRLSTGGIYLADTPAAIYFGSRTTGIVYAITIESDGSIPTLAAPVTAATLPKGDSLVGLGYYLGNLVIQTSTGVRLAAPGDGGSLTFGPQFLDLVAAAELSGVGTSEIRREVVGVGNKVYVAGDTSIVSIDLSQPVPDSDLTFAWATEHEDIDIRVVFYSQGAPGLGYAHANGVKYQTADLAPTGHVVTGYHRFGTLEPKMFSAVKVFVEGQGGSVAISKVDASGATVSLHTLDVTRSSEADITLGMNDTATAVALHFDLIRDPDDATLGPTLLGYQLRALPAPRRQRMIRVPLMLFDVEAKRPVRPSGASSQAWARLRELEAMEEGGGTFLFQDFRTGETGTCFIESVEHEGKRPPSAQDKGFGGVVWLTIRKV